MHLFQRKSSLIAGIYLLPPWLPSWLLLDVYPLLCLSCSFCKISLKLLVKTAMVVGKWRKKKKKWKKKLTGDSQSYRQPTLAREYFRTMIVMAFFSYFFSQVNTTKHMLSWNASADNALAIQQLTRILVFFWKRVSFLKISFQRNTVQEPQLLFVAGTRPISHRVGRSVRRSVGASHFAFLHFCFIERRDLSNVALYQIHYP